MSALAGFISAFAAFGVIVVIPCIFIGRWLAERDIKGRK